MATKEVRYKEKTFPISYKIANPNKKRDFIVLHGWGSNKEIMHNTFKNGLLEYRHIYIDLPGFGKSLNDEVLTTSDYKKILDIFLKELNSKKEIIAGHSFGGKVATLLEPEILVLLSSAGIPVKKSLKVKAKITAFKMLKKMGFGGLYKLFATKDVKGMKKNMYETLKNVVDEDFSDIFRTFNSKTLIFWGKEDKTTPLICGETINRLIQGSQFFPLPGDHFFFVNNSEKILKILSKEVIDANL